MSGVDCAPTSSTDYYNSSGTIDNGGNFSLTSTHVGNTASCANSLSMKGNVSGPGCTSANGTWTNSGGNGGTFYMNHSCFYPTGETNQVFQGFHSVVSSAVYEAATFQLQLAPLSYNWGGRTISETFPQPTVDGCYFPGRAAARYVPITKNIPVDSTGRYIDNIGPATAAVEYYREQGRTPCSFTYQQVMVIDCPNPPANPTYAVVTQTVVIDPLLLTITRGNNPSVSEAFGAPAPALTLPAILFNLLFPTS